jgi:hypothetical protein
MIQNLTPTQTTAIDLAVTRLQFNQKESRKLRAQIMDSSEIERELLLCALSPEYFITQYIFIYDAQIKDWIKFILWAQQLDALNLFHIAQLVIALKARQLGLTWLALAYAIWQMLFRPIATVMVFSRRDDESMYLLSDERARGMYRRLPEWMQLDTLTASAHQWKLSNGSVAYAFPTTAGDSYTSTLVIMDEADLIPNLNRLMRSVKPTIDAGGKMFMISRADKSTPNSEYKRIYRGAKAGLNGWSDIFLPWWVRPSRTPEWYEKQKRDILQRTGGLDDLHEQYPSTDTEALAPASLNKRIPHKWGEQCYVEMKPVETPTDAPDIPGLKVFHPPARHRKYVGGVDCAEGLPSSDDSAATFIDLATGEEVCNLVGKFTPTVTAIHCSKIAEWYNKAKLMIESNNHGHAVIGWLEDNGYSGWLLAGHNDRAGWMSSELGKVLLYDATTEVFKEQETIIHDFETLTQLLSIEKATLRAPIGDMDDRADSYALAIVGRHEMLRKSGSFGFMQGKPRW